jgi:hypothetical protein
MLVENIAGATNIKAWARRWLDIGGSVGRHTARRA